MYIHSISLEKAACSLNLTSGKGMSRQLCHMKQTLADAKRVLKMSLFHLGNVFLSLYKSQL